MQCGSRSARIVEGRCAPSQWNEGNTNAGRLITHVVGCVTVRKPSRKQNRMNIANGMNRKLVD